MTAAMICKPVVRPEGNGTGTLSTGSPPMLAGLVSARMRARFSSVHSAFVSAGVGEAAMTRKS